MKMAIMILLTLLSLLGCGPPEALRQPGTLLLECRKTCAWQPSFEMKVTWTKWALLDTDSQGHRSLEAAHLIALLGPPDRKLTMTEFAALSDQEGSGVALWGGQPIEEAYSIFQLQFGNRGINNEDWQDSEAFLSCDIWVYAWEAPEEVTMGRSGFPRQEWQDRRSYFALIDKGRLIQLIRILRPNEAPQ
jgi:hypothetical protein